MYSRRDDDDDKHYCEYCDSSYYPTIGPPGHYCRAKQAADEKKRQAKGYEDEVVGFYNGDFMRPIIKRRYFR